MMQSDTLLHVANVSTLLVCMVLKFPQIFVLLRAKSTTGLSIKSLVLELIGAKGLCCGTLCSLRTRRIMTTRRQLTWNIQFSLLKNLCTFISAASKFAQLQCLWRSKDAGQVSALTWALATYTCTTRIYTTVATTGDMQVLVRFIAMTLLNLWVLLSVLYYRRHGCSPIKED
ncbi:solute carrier family 66 member 3 isoform X2 [Phycodurus eques]|uniref:solute carrier family 66 member 3 isoform X2 n=1 Tax=Phycodurus eques TaxID=693459 RepID=UPI002ACDBEE1|nr:solute carrier family 66 member 3 isoform X2 [Phycodurus eques]